jgi:hypothetical protein
MRVFFSLDIFTLIYSKSKRVKSEKAQMNDDDKKIIMDENHEMMTTQLLDNEKYKLTGLSLRHNCLKYFSTEKK